MFWERDWKGDKGGGRNKSWDKRDRGKTHKVVQNLVANHLHHLKRLQRRDAVDEHIAMDADEMLRV